MKTKSVRMVIISNLATKKNIKGLAYDVHLYLSRIKKPLLIEVCYKQNPELSFYRYGKTIIVICTWLKNIRLVPLETFPLLYIVNKETYLLFIFNSENIRMN
jgi:hypothetical protein